MNRFLGNWMNIFWPVAALVAVSLHFWFPETPTGITHDTYNPSAEGQKVFFRMVGSQASNIYTWRSREPLNILLEQLSPECVLCILGPERSPTSEEWSALIAWVRNGGSLLYACRGDKEFEIPEWKVKYLPVIDTDDSQEPKTSLVSSKKLAWWSDGKLEAANLFSLVEYDGTTQAVRLNYGSGRAVIVATPLPFSNQLLSFGENSVLAMRLLESAGNVEYVTFDESLNSSGTSKIVGILFDPFLRPITIQILIVTVLFGWWHGRRFGPLTPSAVTARQNIVEHTDMVGSWYWKTKEGHGVLKAYLRQLTTKLKLKAFRGNEDRVLEPIARRSGRELSELRKELQEAYRAVRSKHVDRRTAANLIRRLALIRRAATAERS